MIQSLTPDTFTHLAQRGFLPNIDPKTQFPEGSTLQSLDTLGQNLPDLLQDETCRHTLAHVEIPHWPDRWPFDDEIAYLRLYYLRLAFLASAYVHQVGQPPANTLPANIAVPLHHATQRLARPPILSYDGYALYNWRRIDPNGPIALGNIDTLQNFVKLYDEHWFILVHVEIEAIAATILRTMLNFPVSLAAQDSAAMQQALHAIAAGIRQQEAVLRRIPEKMDPALYDKTFRPYIRYFEQVRFQGVDMPPVTQRGETGAQSSIMPSLVAFMKIPHAASQLTDHLRDMRRYMPPQHRQFIEWIEQQPDFRTQVASAAFNAVLDAIADFRRVHFEWAQTYINRYTDDPKGTGGTPYMQWLQQLIDETLAHRK